MKPTRNSARGVRMIGFAAAIISWFPTLLPAQDVDSVPVIEFTPGLPGTQARITWHAEPGARYAIEKSPDLSPGSWKRLALVEPAQADAVWLDPETVTERCFYRVTRPQPEVFAIEPAVLTETGGLLVIRGQALPPGSSLMLETEGGGTEFFTLVRQGDGTWHADVTGTFASGAALTARVRAGGQILPATIHPLVTVSGLMADGPASLPPAAPGSFYPNVIAITIDGIYTVSGRRGGGNPLDEGGGHGGENPLYQGRGSQNNPAFQENHNQGDMPDLHMPLSSGLPGEVGFHTCDFALHTPAGPALSWVRTYRSKGGTAPQGTAFSYDIRIEPDPAGLGAAASRVRVFDGTGRSDIFHRQPDGSFTCDGLFREGRFVGEIFTLTFFDQGRWVFRALDGSPAAGKISSIIDVHGNTLACDYDTAGQLASVSSAFGQSLTVARDTLGRVATVTDHTGRFIAYSYYEQGETGGPPGFLKSVSCPIIPGQPPVCGPVGYTYTTGQPHPALDGNLLSIHDGAGRLLEAFTYSSQTAPAAIDFDTLATHDAHRTDPASDAVRVLNLVRLPDGVAPFGGYTVFHNDEAGRLTEVVFDPMHRPVSVKQFTGFATPGQACDATTNRPTGKLRATDPDFYETTASYNADGMPRRCTLPDGTQLVAVFERDLNPACAARERGNARTLTIRSAGGEERTVSCDHLPGFGTPESARPGNPIKGLNIKAARNLSDGPMAQARRRVEVLKSNFHADSAARGNPIKGMTIKNGTNKRAGIDDDCDGPTDEDCDGIGMTTMFRKILDYGEAGDSPRIARLTTAHGQVFTWTHDAHGRCVAHATPVAGQGFTASYDPQGRCVSRTILDGTGPGFRTDVHYAAATGFLHRVVIDPDGLALTEIQDCDDLGRPIRYTDPRGHQWLIEYNALDLPTRIESPPAQGGQSISTRFYYDGGGTFWCGKTDHLRSDGSPVQENTDYATIVVRDSRGRVIRIAEEERPVDFDPTTVIDPADLGIENFAILDITYGPDGRCVRLSTPAASRGEIGDAVCDFTYDERGLLHRVRRGGPTGVTHEYHRTAAGQVSRRAIVAGQGLPASEVHFAYDGFHRISSYTDAIGNQAAFAYSSRGHVTSSVFGEVHDEPGSAGNVLLARQRVRLAKEWVKPCPSHGMMALSKKGYDHYAAQSDTATHRVSKKGYDYYKAASSDLSATPGGPTGDCDDSDPRFDALTLPGISDVCYSINVKVSPSSAGRSASGSILDELDDSDGPGIVALELPTVQDACYSIHKKGRSPRLTDSLFHSWFVADDTLEAERFAPGDPAPHPVEVTTVTRSPAGLPLHISRNGDSLATCEYDSSGRLSSISNAATRTEFVLDAAGNTTSTTRTDFSTAQGLPAKSFTYSRLIDPLGRTTSLTDGSGNTAHFAYDSLHRPTSFTDPEGVTFTTSYDGVLADGSPYSERRDYDSDGDSIPDTFLGATYIRCGALRSTTDAAGYATFTTRDALGRITRFDHPDGTFETLAYDARGFLSEIRHRDGTTSAITCDLSGRVVAESITGGSPDQPAAPDRLHRYDARGFVTQISEGTAVCAWTYDSLGNVLAETQSGETITHTYDHRGRTGYATSVQWPYKLSIAETRDAQGRLRVVTARDDAGQPISPPVATMEYLGSRVARCDTANGISTVHTYRGDGDPALPDTTNFGFDLCVLTESTHQGSAIFASKKGYDYYQAQSSLRIVHRDLAARNFLHERDPLGRIIASQIVFDAGDGILQTEHDVAYTLNVRGDRLSATGGENPGQYTQSDTLPPGDAQRGRYTSWPHGPVQWDANGNLTHLPTATGGHQYQQDTRGRLVAITDGATGETLAEFSYDGCDRLVGRVLHAGAGLPPAITRFLYDGQVCVHEIDMATGTPERSHVCGITSHLRTTTGGGDTYFHHGGEGRCGSPYDPLLLTNAAGTPVEIISYNDAGLPLRHGGNGRAITQGQGTDHAWAGGSRATALWVPSVRLHLLSGGASSPDLGMQVCSGKKHERTGHVTLMK